MKQYGEVLVRTTELVVTIVAFILLGNWLDKKLQTDQVALIVSTILGSIFAFIRFVVSLQKLNKQDQ
ncbi:MAG: AtpZ/AtpI family protein [Oligoflexia bacterium]|nr:AtpZ/AtpI family protein [Oligoflexia bacterium]